MSGKWIDVKGNKAAHSKTAAAAQASNNKKAAVAAAALSSSSNVKKSPTNEELETPPVSAPTTPSPANAQQGPTHVDPHTHNAQNTSGNSPSIRGTTSGVVGSHHRQHERGDSTHTPRARTPVRTFVLGAGHNHDDPLALNSTYNNGGDFTARGAHSGASPLRELNPHTAISRYKATLRDILAMLANPAHVKNIDTFIELTEEATKDLKKLKMQVRNTKVPAKQSTTSSSAAGAGGEKEGSQAQTAAEDGEAHNTTAPTSARSGAKSWASLLKTSSSGALLRSPSKKEMALSQRQQDASMEADRSTSAAKGEARRHEAAERKNEKDHTKSEDAKSHNAKVAERVQEVKQRLKEEADVAREASRERQEHAAQRHDEIQEGIREKSVKHSQRVEEVLFVNELANQNKAMRIEGKNLEAEHQIEAKREEQRLAAKERTEAREAALERSKELSQQKVEKAKERELQRQEQVKRHEEQKKSDAESRHAKTGEREKKVLDHKQAAAAEAESKKQKAEERIIKSQQIRDEQRAQEAAKRREKDTKTKERMAEPATKTTISEILVKETPAEEEQINTRLAKASASIARHARLFVEQYQKDCPLGIKDVNKSKFRALTTRLIGTNGGPMSRQVLKDMNTFLAPIDHEYARYFNVFEHFMSIITEARKADDHATFKLCADMLHKLLLDPAEGPASARYFVRAGHAVPLIAMIHEEIKMLQKHNRSAALTVCFSLLQCCVQCIVADASTNAKLAPIRDQLMDLLEVAGVDKFCFAIASTCVDAEDMACLQYALMILQLQIMLTVKKKTDASEWYQTATVSLFTLLQNILNPGGIRARDDAITHNTMLVILSSFRLLNIITRHKSSVVGTLLRDNESARMELFHMIGAFFGYVSRNETAVLERIPQDSAQHETALSKSFEDALQLGMTLQHIPRAPLPSYNLDGTGFTPSPSSARSSVSQASTIHGGSGKGITRAAVHELLLFIGIAAIGEPKVQEIFSWGKEKPLLQVILTALNINYFNKGRHILFPTVLSIIARDDRNRTIAEREMDCKSLFDFLVGEVQCLPQKQQKKIKSSDVVATPSLGPAASPPPPPPPPAPESAMKKLFSINWADMSDGDDDDDDDTPAATPAAAEGGEVASSSAGAAPEQSLQTKKDKMLQLVKNSASYNSFFRIENRIPRPMWSDIGRFLEEGLQGE